MKAPEGGKMRCDAKQKQRDAATLKRLREIRGLSRKEAGALLSVGYKAIEKMENGRAILSRPRIDKTMGAYGLTYEDFLLCREGRSEQIEERFGYKGEAVVDKKNRRFCTKIISKEVQVLTALRKLKNLSQYKASAACGYHSRAISNIESGRVKLPLKRIIHIVKSYGFAMEDFEYHMKSDALMTDIQDECVSC